LYHLTFLLIFLSCEIIFFQAALPFKKKYNSIFLGYFFFQLSLPLKRTITLSVLVREVLQFVFGSLSQTN